ncbi:hypothetical protein MKX03_004413 [Papaver bracteatum]|nr:hypothetical protein MKX03_004413 [Papaver bracteatum]
MVDNTKNQGSEGGSGQEVEIGNMEIVMKSIADMTQHQHLLEERLGISSPRHNSADAVGLQGKEVLPCQRRNYNQPDSYFSSI